MTTLQHPPHARSSAPEAARCRVMGIVNVTPDSFSDGGRYVDPTAAIEHGLALVRQGADLVDVGGESTRPGAERVAEEDELRRVLPVVRALSSAGAQVSIDTMRASVAAAAVDAGATLVNDVSGGLADPEMLPFLAEAGVGCVLMHWRAHSKLMQERATYRSVAEDVRTELARRCDAAMAAGVSADRIILDPGLGFAKAPEHSWSLLARLPRLMSLGFPLLVGASRKRFLAECVGGGDLDAAHPTDRDAVSAAVATVAALTGAWGVRVHDVPAAVAGARVAARLAAEWPER
ncbi:dihydropteroate synthase [Nocardioides bizhenqiangii]|uniref:Dihydropteroate synthase n=1 Tax=Nocardioides bizhenqiangii TaxID=3095076 RepID=A0ABZ0ZTI2_9ACTN|nr:MULTISPECIES: dihydropteroate synthase [unclassified Nocardioides]MDZ5621707.1 dihydropteroate synthase [Nocardioides sp. HM23]WQQ27607.1 dihydropteroate synthase [Nocardioides sp. HM61]